MARKQLRDLKIGDQVERVLGGTLIMRLTITAISGNKITCSEWEFDRRNGQEIEPQKGFGTERTGSFIRSAI